MTTSDNSTRLYWHPTPNFEQLGGDGVWAVDFPFDYWATEDTPSRSRDNVGFSNGDIAVFPDVDGDGGSVLSSDIRVRDTVTVGGLEGFGDVLLRPQQPNDRLIVENGAIVATNDLTMQGVLGGNTSFTVTGLLILTETSDFSGHITVDDGQLSLRGDLGIGADVSLTQRADFFIGPGASLTGTRIEMDRTGLDDRFRSTVDIEGDADAPTTVTGIVRAAGDNTEIDVLGNASLTASRGTAIRGTEGGQSVDVGDGALIDGAVRLGEGRDAVTIGAGTLRGFVSTEEGRDFVSVSGDFFGETPGLLDGNLQMGADDDDLRVDAGGRITGSVQMGRDDDEVELNGRIDGAMRLSTGDDTLRMEEDDARLATKLLAQRGDDVLIGGGGADEIAGGAGADRMSGGRDADVFVFATAAEAGLGATADTITDFSGAPGALLFTTDGADGTLQGDLDGDSAADFEILLAGVTDMSAGDLIL